MEKGHNNTNHNKKKNENGTWGMLWWWYKIYDFYKTILLNIWLSQFQAWLYYLGHILAFVKLSVPTVGCLATKVSLGLKDLSVSSLKVGNFSLLSRIKHFAPVMLWTITLQVTLTEDSKCLKNVGRGHGQAWNWLALVFQSHLIWHFQRHWVLLISKPRSCLHVLAVLC